MKKAISEKNEIFWQELIWREFFMQILYHFPDTSTEAFKKKLSVVMIQLCPNTKFLGNTQKPVARNFTTN
jgi:deoxyribodipyrimidine photolyase